MPQTPYKIMPEEVEEGHGCKERVGEGAANGTEAPKPVTSMGAHQLRVHSNADRPDASNGTQTSKPLKTESRGNQDDTQKMAGANGVEAAGSGAGNPATAMHSGGNEGPSSISSSAPAGPEQRKKLEALRPLPRKRHMEDDGAGESVKESKGEAGSVVSRVAGAGAKVDMPKIDLQKAREIDGELTETQKRVEKLRQFEHDCTELREYLYVSGLSVSQNQAQMADKGITHIVNCAGMTAANAFPQSFKYTTLYMNDDPAADLVQHLYRVVAFIDEARGSGGKVLVHCHQGVSRSCSYCMAYLMLRDKLTYHQAYTDVKAKRGIANPNLGFASQLIDWEKRLAPHPAPDTPALGARPPRAYRIGCYMTGGDIRGCEGAAESADAGEQLSWCVAAQPQGVWLGLPPPHDQGKAPASPYVLSSDDVYLVEQSECVYVWEGARASASHRGYAQLLVSALQEHEGAAKKVVTIEEGSESDEIMHYISVLGCSLPRAGAVGNKDVPPKLGLSEATLKGGKGEGVMDKPPLSAGWGSRAGPVAADSKFAERVDGVEGDLLPHRGMEVSVSDGAGVGGGEQGPDRDQRGKRVRMWQVPSGADDKSSTWDELDNFDSVSVMFVCSGCECRRCDVGGLSGWMSKPT